MDKKLGQPGICPKCKAQNPSGFDKCLFCGGTTELLPCPFCGSEDAYIFPEGNLEKERYDYCWGQCPDCEAEGPSCKDSRDEAIQAWNRRVK